MMEDQSAGAGARGRNAFERTLEQAFDEAWRIFRSRGALALGVSLEHDNEPAQAYQSAAHLRDCLALSEASEVQAECHTEVRLALAYHDVICAPGAVDNEAESAALFRAHADASGLAIDVRERIARMIEGAAQHAASERDAALVSDIDLAILGLPPDESPRYGAVIVAECAHAEGMSIAPAERRSFDRSSSESRSIRRAISLSGSRHRRASTLRGRSRCSRTRANFEVDDG